ncbi:MAG: DNA polymerase III subunit delta, partial [Gammaproteobacteria bacterium]|nr:DNA polymerase III subunit delta [Gammaproteobacteria bacterium]
MKVNADQLGTHLKKSPATQVYLVSGDEPLLVQESTDQIRQYLRQQGFTEREVHQVERGFDWAEILFSANSMSLFADRKIIEIRSSGTLGEPAGSAVMSFLAQSSEDTALLLITGRLDASLQKRKWFTQMEKHVMWVPIWPIERRDLPGWMARRLKQAGLKADKDVINCLCDRVEGNLLAAAQEIERLALLVSDGVLT